MHYSPTLTFARDLAQRVLDAVLPPRCLSCTATVTAPGALCATCWAGLNWLAPPWCAACGLAFEHEAAPGALCGACLSSPPAFGRARAALVYDDASRRLVVGFKHADRTEAAPAFAAWLSRVGREVLDGAELLVPVPLHRWRLLRRRYNQAALLALAVGRMADIPVLPDALVRVRPTRAQGGLDRAGRAANLKSAIEVRPHRRVALAGRRVVVVDDVLTTGATATACARALLRAGAGAVDVLTLARVPRPL